MCCTLLFEEDYSFTTSMRMYGISTLKTTKNLTAALTVEAQFAGGGVAPSISAIVSGVPAFRGYAATNGLHTVIAQSMLVAHGWYDNFYMQSNNYISLMISDILNNRQGVNDAVNIFVSRLQDLYTPN